MKPTSKSIQLLLVCIVTISIIAAFLMMDKPFGSSALSVYPPPDPYPGPLTTPGPTEVPITPTPASTEAPKIVSITLQVTLDGLEGRDVAEFELLPGNQITSASLASLGVTLPKSNATDGVQKILVENIPIGVYKLILNAPPEYFRQPKGYEFGVSDEGKIINNPDRILDFKLISPSDQSLPPCRLFDIAPLTSTPMQEPKDISQEGKEVCMAEGIIDISAPRMKPEGESRLTPEFYHYAGPKTTQDNQGVWGRSYVVDPILTHDGSYNQFVAERVYADNGSDWMEAGWKEDSWKDERQYVYVSGSFLNGDIEYFEEYQISSGSAVEAKVYYDSNIAKWKATYFLGGSSWRVLWEDPLGFITADNGYNRGEAYTANETHPLLPPSRFDTGNLFISGVWRTWDTRYLTDETSDAPYQLDMINKYYHFSIHSRMNYLPLVMIQ